MSGRAYSEIHLRLVWRVKENRPLLRGPVENHVHEFIRRKITDSKIVLHGIGGTDDHVHIAVQFPVDISVSEWVGRLKGACSFFINNQILNRKEFEWQSGYGVTSFGTKDLPWVVEYIRNQRMRHASKDVYERLERDEPEQVQNSDG